jgi:hypothetical protein
VLLRERPDFVQIDHSLDDREAEKRVLPAAAYPQPEGAKAKSDLPIFVLRMPTVRCMREA